MNAGIPTGGTVAAEHPAATHLRAMPTVTWSPEEEGRAARLELIRSSIELSDENGTLHLSLERCFKACIGLKVRPTQARRHLKSAIKDHCVLRWQSDAAAIVQLIEPRIGADLFRELAATYLAEVAGEPVTPRLLIAAPRCAAQGRAARRDRDRAPPAPASGVFASAVAGGMRTGDPVAVVKSLL